MFASNLKQQSPSGKNIIYHKYKLIHIDEELSKMQGQVCGVPFHVNFLKSLHGKHKIQ
jgi:hypothetical protein